MLKKILIGLGVLIVVLLAMVTIGPRLIDWNSYKPRVIAAVMSATGRALAIDGDVSLSLLPSPTLSVAGVRLANIQGGSAPDMAQLKSLEVSVALAPLLSGDIQVTKVTLVDPLVLLEQLPDGRANWQLAPGGAPAGGAAGSVPVTGAPGGSLPSITVDELAIENGTVIYRSGATEKRIESVDATISARSLTGPFVARGQARIGGDSATFEVDVGALGSRPTALRLLIKMAGDAAVLTFEGTADQAALALKGRLDAAVAAPGPLLKLAGVQGLPPLLAKPFQLSAGIDADAHSLELPDIAVSLGDDKATGKVSVRLGRPLQADVTLAFARLDLDKLLPEVSTPAVSGAASGAPAEGAPPSTRGSFALAGGIPSGIIASLDLSAEAVVYHQGVIDHPRLAAHLADGELQIKQASAKLPGGTDVNLAGTVTAKDGQPQFTGALQAKSEKPRELVAWLGAKLPPTAGDRPRSLTMTSRVSASTRQAGLADLDIKLDATDIQGGVSVALPDGTARTRPGFTIALTLDQIDLDGYMPIRTAGAAASPTAVPGKKASPLEILAPLADVDADFDLKAGILTLNAEAVRGLRLQGTLSAGKLTIADASVQDIGGGQGAISGSIVDLAKEDPRYDLTLALSAPNAEQVFKLAGLGQRGSGKIAPGTLGALSVDGALKGGADTVDYDLAFAVTGAGMQGAAKGSASGLQGGGMPRIDSTISAAATNAGPLLQYFGVPAAAADKLGMLGLDGKAQSGQDFVDYDLALDLPGLGGKGTFRGKVTGLSKSPRLASDLKLKVAQAGPLLALAGLNGPGPDQLGAMSVAGRANISADAIDYDLAVDLPDLGGKGAFLGKVTGLSKTPAVASDLKLEVAQAGPLLALAGLSAPGLDRVGALKLTGKASASPDGIDYDLTLDLPGLSGEGAFQGKVTGLPKTPQVATNLKLDIARLGPLMSLAGRGGPDADRLGALSLAGKASASPNAIDYDLTLDLPGLGGKGAFQGRVTGLAKTPQLATNLKLEIAQSGALLALAGFNRPGMDRLGAISLAGKASASPDSIDYDLALDLPGLTGKGTFQGKVSGLSTTPKVATNLRLDVGQAGAVLALMDVTRPGLDRLGALSLAGTANAGADSIDYDLTLDLPVMGGKGAFQGQATGLSKTPQLATKLKLDVAQPGALFAVAGFNGPGLDRLGAMTLAGRASTSGDAIDYDLTLELPGVGGTGAFKGQVSDLSKTPQLATKLKLDVAKAGALLAVAGLEGPGLDRLGAMSLAGKANTGPDAVDYDLTLDLPDLGGKGAFQGEVSGLSKTPQVATNLKLEIAQAGHLLALAGLKGPGLERLGAMNLAGKANTSPDTIDYDLTLDLPDLGSTGAFQGQVTGLSKTPRAATNLKLDVAQAGTLLALAGFGGPGLDRLGAMSLAGKANTSPDAADYDLALDLPAVGGKGSFQGQVTSLSKEAQVTANLKIDVAEAGPLLTLAGLSDATAGNFGALGLSGRLNGDSNSMGLALDLAALGGSANVEGTVAAAKSPMAFDLTLSADHPDANVLLPLILGNLRSASSAPRPVTLKARLAGDERKFALVDAAMQFAGTDFTASGTVALGTGPTALQLQLKMADDAAVLSFDGTVDQAALALKGKLDATVAEPGPLLKLAGVEGVPPVLSKPMTLSTDVDADAHSLELPDIALSLGDDKATGKFSVQMGQPLLANMTLAFARLDLDKLLPEVSAPAAFSAPTAGTAPSPPPAPEGGGFVIPGGITASVDLSAEAVVYRQEMIGQPHLVAHLADGELQIKEVSAKLPGGSEFNLAGTVAGKDGQPQFTGALQARSEKLRDLMAWLGADLPPTAGNRLQAFAMTSRVIASATQAELADLDIKLDATHIQGGANVALPDGATRSRPGFGIDLAIDRIDLDGYMPVKQAGTTASAAAGAASSPAKKISPLAALAPLADVDANFDLRAGMLTLNGQAVRGLHLQGTLFAGKLTIADASVKDIGGGQGAVSGSIVDLAKDDPRYDLKLALSAPNAGQVFQLAGLGKSAPGKLGALSVNGAVQGGADKVDYDLAFAVTGAGVQGAAKGSAAGLQGGGMPRIDSTVSATAKNAGPLLQLFGVPAAAAAKLGTLGLNGKAASGQDSVDYDLALDLPGLGGKGSFQGKVTGLSKAPQVATNLKLDVAQAGPLLALAGLSGPGMDQLGAMSLVGKANTSPDAVDYDLALDLPGLGGKGAFQGRLTGLSKTPQVATNLKLDVAQPGPLLTMAGLSGAAAGKLGALGVNGRLDGGADAMKLALNLAALGGNASVNGTVAAMKSPMAFDLALSASHPDANTLLPVFVSNFRSPPSGPRPLKLSAKVAGNAQKFALSGFALQIAGTDLSGAGTVGLGSRPSIQGSFASNHMNTAVFGVGGGAGGGQSQGGQSQGGGHWSRQRLDLTALDTLDAALDYKAGQFVSGSTRIDNLVAKINLAAGTLVINTLTGNLYGGSFAVQNGRVVARGTPSFSARVITSNLELSQLSNSGHVKGPISVNADVAGSGASQADIVSSLQGRGKLAGRVTVLSKFEQTAGAALLGALGSKVTMLKGITGTLSNVVTLFTGKPNDLGGDFTINQGVVSTENTTATNPQAKALFHGKIFLPPWTMAMLVDIFQLPQTAKPAMTVNLKGPIDGPNVGVSGVALQQNAPALGGNSQSGNPLQQLLQGVQPQQPASSGGTSGGGSGSGNTSPVAPLLQNLLGGKKSNFP